MSEIKFYEVGGAVRDSLLGLASKDVDFAVEAESFEYLIKELERRGFKIFDPKPEYLTLRARVPESEKQLFQRTKVADFVMCRKDSSTGDGRRPDFVEPGTIFDDLKRRDFTVNAIARDPATNDLIDPHEGRADLENNTLRFVGDPMKRIMEDGLRVLRGFRFTITKDLNADDETWAALRSREAATMLMKVSIERVREELERMFSHNTDATIDLLGLLPPWTREAVFRDGLRLMPTLKQ